MIFCDRCGVIFLLKNKQQTKKKITNQFRLCEKEEKMDTKNEENLQEFSEPLLRKSKLPRIKPLRKEKKNKNCNNNNNNDNNNSNNNQNSSLRSNASTYSILPISEVTQGAVEVWATLPDEIRQDPSLASFRQEHERIHGKWPFWTKNEQKKKKNVQICN